MISRLTSDIIKDMHILKIPFETSIHIYLHRINALIRLKSIGRARLDILMTEKKILEKKGVQISATIFIHRGFLQLCCGNLDEAEKDIQLSNQCDTKTSKD